MSPELEELIKRSKGVMMTPEEREAQRRSFAFGNLNIEDPKVTRESIDLAAKTLAKESPHGPEVGHRTNWGTGNPY